MDRLLDRFTHSEVTPEAPAEPAAEAPSAEPAAPAEPEAPPEYAQIPAAEWEATQQRLEQLGPVADYLGNLPDDAFQQQQQPQFDPYTGQPLQQQAPQMPDPYVDPQGFQQWQQDQMRAIVDERLQPLSPVFEHTMSSVSDQVTNAAVDELTGDYPFLNAEDADQRQVYRKTVVDLADSLVMQGEQDAHKALRQAADYVKQIGGFERAAGVKDFLASRGEGGPTDREPASGGNGLPGMGEPTSYAEAARRVLGSG